MRRIAAIPYHLPGSLYHGWKMKSLASVKSNGDNHNPPRAIFEDETAFDQSAENYDSAFTNTTTGRQQRRQVHSILIRRFDPVIYPQVLEINGGTGEDAAWFTRNGFSVTYSDASEAMVKIARKKFADAGLVPLPDSRVLPFSRIHELPAGAYDIVFSNFGGLNCIGPDSLKQTFRVVGERLRRGGKFIAVFMGRNCILEKLYFRLKNDRTGSRRRGEHGPVTAHVDGRPVSVWYYAPGEIRNLTEPVFTFNRVTPIGLFVPPSYLDRHFARVAALPVMAMAADRLLSGFSSLSDYADHYLIEFTRP
jgi:hypothetical protein